MLVDFDDDVMRVNEHIAFSGFARIIERLPFKQSSEHEIRGHAEMHITGLHYDVTY